MTTVHVLDQLPLWVEGDLPAQAREVVQAHIDLCPACRAAAEDLRISQAWLRDAMEPPFDASDREALRRAVLNQVRQEQPKHSARPLRLHPVLLGACAATLLVVGLAILRRFEPIASPTPAPGPALALQSLPVPAEVGPALAHSRKVRSLPTRTQRQPPETPPASSSEGPARIEFQLPDSNTRIIWLAQTKPLPNPNDTPQEAL